VQFAPVSTPFDDDPFDDLESIGARAREAERLLKRSLRNTLEDRLEQAARTLPFFEKVLGRGGMSGPSTNSFGRAANPMGPALRSESQGAVSASLGFRLDAHPRLQIRTRVLSMTGLLEVPVLDREIRLSLDQPLGRHGRASLRGGASADGNDWATLSFSLQF
jgi:hypothetical protein